MKKALVITSVASMVDQFLLPNIKLLQNIGYDVHVACNFEKGSSCSDEKIAELKQKLSDMEVAYFQINFERDVTNLSGNLKAYKQVVALVRENGYDLVHCHSPIGGMITRLACRKVRKKGTKVFYTAHGFHFYEGAPKKNWLLYYPVEKFCAHFTDTLITMNKEDYALAAKKMKTKRVAYVPGVGIDIDRFGGSTVGKAEKRVELGIPQDARVLFSIGELNANKNHETVIRAIADTELYYIIAGRGALQEQLQALIDSHGMSERVRLLGFRKDVKEIFEAADVFVFPSFREGLSVSVMEAMASGLPVVCSKIRGNTDLIDENGGFWFDPSSVSDCRRAIDSVLASDEKALGEYNKKKIEDFSVENVCRMLKYLYETENA